MKETILALKADLTTNGFCDYYSGDNVFLSIDEDLLPRDVTFPAIGIKDGEIDYLYEEYGTRQKTYTIDLWVYYEAPTADETHTGSGAANPDGILGFMKNLVDHLEHNKLGIASIEQGLPLRETPSELFGGEDFFVMRKMLTIEYVRLEETI